MKKILPSIFMALTLLIIGLHQAKADTASISPANVGTFTQWLPIPSSYKNYVAVKEYNCNGDTNYVITRPSQSSSTKDSYLINLTNIPDDSKITSVEISACGAKTQNYGWAGLQYLLITNGVQTLSPEVLIATSTVYSNIQSKIFSGLNIYKTASTTIEIGIAGQAFQTDLKVSRVFGKITYTPPVPNTPSGLEGSVEGMSVNLNWLDNSSNEKGFKIERKEAITSSTTPSTWKQIATTKSNISSYIDSTIISGKNYWYRVRSYLGTSNSSYSNSIFVQVP